MTQRAQRDAGFTILELVVALGILAGLLTVVATSIRPPASVERVGPEALKSFLAMARTEAILSGEAQRLVIRPGNLSFAKQGIEWDDPGLFVSDGQSGTTGDAVIVYADGSLSGNGLFVHVQDRAERLDGVYRGGVLAP